MGTAGSIVSIIVGITAPVLFIGGLVAAMARKQKAARMMLVASFIVCVVYVVIVWGISSAS